MSRQGYLESPFFLPVQHEEGTKSDITFDSALIHIHVDIFSVKFRMLANNEIKLSFFFLFHLRPSLPNAQRTMEQQGYKGEKGTYGV